MDARRDAPVRVLNLGCGEKRRPGAVNVDLTSRTAPDVVHDLNVRPWPFEAGRFRQVYAMDVIEHLDDVVQAMEEMHRVCDHGAAVEITVPHFSCANAFTDPTHRHFFGRFSFDYFTEGHELDFYTTARFRIARATLVFHPGLLNRVVARLANRYPRQYERRWAWAFPAWFLSFDLRVIKQPVEQSGRPHVSEDS